MYLQKLKHLELKIQKNPSLNGMDIFFLQKFIAFSMMKSKKMVKVFVIKSRYFQVYLRGYGPNKYMYQNLFAAFTSLRILLCWWFLRSFNVGPFATSFLIRSLWIENAARSARPVSAMLGHNLSLQECTKLIG